MTLEMAKATLNTPFDSGWAQCPDKHACMTMASIMSPELMQHTKTASTQTMAGDNKWIEDQLSHFSGPPLMQLRTLSVDEFESPADYYAILLRLPLPDSNNPDQFFAVGRLGYSDAATIRDVEKLKIEVKELMDALVLHEVKEWMRYDGKHIVDPHPELRT